MKYSFLTVAAGVLMGSLAHAVVIVPRPHQGPADDQAHKDYVYKQIPWLGSEQNGFAQQNAIPGVFASEFTLLPKLVDSPEYARLAAERPGLQTLTLEFVEKEKKKIKTATARTAEIWHGTVAEALDKVRKETGGLNSAVIREYFLKLWRQGSETTAKGILTGVINSLPPQERGAFFKIPSVGDQIKALRDSPIVTDQQLAAGFKAELVGLDGDAVTKDAILGLAEKANAREEMLLALIQAQWMSERLQGLHPDLVKDARECQSDDLDVFSTDNGERADFLVRVASLISGKPKDAPTLKRVQALVKGGGGEFEERELEVSVVKDYYTIREVPPTLGVWRGYLGGDCSTSSSFGYPYSPMERTYYVYGSDGSAKGYAGATVVMSEGKRTLYFHDVTGAHMADWLAERVMHALYLAADRVDPAVTRFTITTTEVNFRNANYQILYDMHKKYSENKPTLVKQEYLDGEIRAMIRQHPGNAGGERAYDMPEFNAEAVIFRPDPEILSKIRVKVENRSSYAIGLIDEPIGLAETEPTPAELARTVEDWIRGGLAGEPQPELVPVARSIVDAIMNGRGAPIGEYYRQASDGLAIAGIAVDDEFIETHPEYFEIGHLRAPDVTTGAVALATRTVQYVVRALESGRNLDRAIEVIGMDPAMFQKKPKFAKAFEKIIADPKKAALLGRLVAAGLEVPGAENDVKHLEVKLQAAPNVRTAIQLVEKIKAQVEGYRVPDAVLIKIAAALENSEEAEDDDTSRRAAEFLAVTTTRNKAVLADVRESLKEEEDPEMRVLAAISLARSGTATDEELEVLQEAKKDAEVSKRLQAMAREALKEFDCDARLKGPKNAA